MESEYLQGVELIINSMGELRQRQSISHGQSQ